MRNIRGIRNTSPAPRLTRLPAKLRSSWESFGGALTDVLYGTDELTGGGTDIFLFDAPSHSALGAADAVLDFTAGDVIDLSRIDSNISAGAIGDQGFYSIGAAAFSGTGAGAAGQLPLREHRRSGLAGPGRHRRRRIGELRAFPHTSDADPLTASDFMM